MDKYIVQSLSNVLEETTGLVTDKLIMNHLVKHGSVNLEEADFYNNLALQIITEAAEDFIPDELDIPEAEEPMELYDAEGNRYYFDNGQLIPAPSEDGDVDGDVDGEYTEGTQHTDEIIEESTNTVARILANIKNRG